MSEHTVIGKIHASPERAPDGPGQAFSAGEALVQPSLNRISIRGRVAQVEPKVMQVLMLMAARPGTVIARSTFLDTVWAGTVADDYLLNRAISELRRILDDDPQAPRYIETIRKGGYRLVAPIAPARVAAALAPAAAGDAAVPVAAADHAEATAPQASDPPSPRRRDRAGPRHDAVLQAGSPATSPAPARTAPALTATGQSRPGAWLRLVGLGAVLLVVGLAIWRPWTDKAPTAAPPQAYTVQPLTSLVGRELEPAISPDGSRVAFIRDGEGGFDVYVKVIGSEEALRLSDGEGDARHPLWTPDGRALLFARGGEDGISIMRVSALGGTATRVFQDPAMRELRGMGLSPDGTRLAYAARADAAGPYQLHLAELANGGRRVLTDPGSGVLGDLDPRFVPDGRSIAFARAVNEVTRDLHRVPVDGGAVERLTFDNRKINGLAWSPDGQRLLFTSTRSGLYALWSLSADDGGEPVQVALGNEDVHQPATAPGIDAIVFEQWMHRSHLRQVDLASGVELDPGPRFRSTRWDSNPVWSPDGRRIAFSSNRGGPQAIWTSQADGSGAVEIASFDGSFVDNPAWSPDGARIAFDASPDGRTAIYVVAAQGGRPRLLVDGTGDNRRPAWSRDGAWLYFESNRSGTWRVYARPAGGGEAVAVTPATGWRARESADGRFLLYAKPDAAGLWRVPRRDWSAGRGPSRETLLLPDLEPADAGNWASADVGVYYVRRSGDAPVLSLHASADGATVDLLELAPGFEGWGFDLSPDQSRLLFSELTMRESDLRLALPL